MQQILPIFPQDIRWSINRQDSSRWRPLFIFVTDPDLTGAPTRLRFGSIDDIKLYNSYAIIQLNHFPVLSKSIFIVDIRTGITCRLKKAGMEIYSVKIENEDLIIYGENKSEIKKIKLPTLFEELGYIGKLNR